jgi:hypothetical protein
MYSIRSRPGRISFAVNFNCTGFDSAPGSSSVKSSESVPKLRRVQRSIVVDVRQPFRGVRHREFPGVRVDPRDAHRQAVDVGLLVDGRLPLRPQLSRPGQQRQFVRLQAALAFDVFVGPAADPWTGQIGFAVRQPRDRPVDKTTGVPPTGTDFTSCCAYSAVSNDETSPTIAARMTKDRFTAPLLSRAFYACRSLTRPSE